MMIEVIENPRRKTRRRTKRRKTTKRRRNPALATLSANPRRRRRYSRPSRRRYSRRRRNPKFLGMSGFDLSTPMWVGVGMLGSAIVPGLVRKVWKTMPGGGMMDYVVKAGGTFVTAFVVKKVTKSSRNFSLIMAGGLAMIGVDLFRQFVMPKIGLSGLGFFDDSYVYPDELTDVYGSEISGYVDETGLTGDVEENPVGAY